MITTCPNCQEKINTKNIKATQKKGIHLEKKCPFCETWFRLKAPLAVIKTIGLSSLLITSLLNMFTIKNELSYIFSSVGFIGIVIALLITFWGKQEKIYN